MCKVCEGNYVVSNPNSINCSIASIVICEPWPSKSTNVDYLEKYHLEHTSWKTTIPWKGMKSCKPFFT
jgi:hypothetical protein